jgi:AraC-like DNA-binding protein
MDRHDVSESVTAEMVAQLHQQDLKVQHQFECRGLTYWFDENRKTAFCLVEAPDEKSVISMHNHAHGEVPHRIIEVEPNIVESFLGRIEDPEKAKKTSLNIINDPAFRTIMVIVFPEIISKNKRESENGSSIHNLNNPILEIILGHDGRVVNQSKPGNLVSFKSVTKAVLCAKAIVDHIRIINTNNEGTPLGVKICLNSGVPVTERESIFEETIKLAERMNFVAKTEIVVSSEVKDLFKSENNNQFIDNTVVYTLSLPEERFLNSLIDFIEAEWKNPKLKVDDFGKIMGISKSQLYRNMILLLGESPNSFLMTFRLNKAKDLLKKKDLSISEIAFDSGFSSPSYFTKCFNKRFNLSPSECFHNQD